jgi:hypothetical protein
MALCAELAAAMFEQQQLTTQQATPQHVSAQGQDLDRVCAAVLPTLRRTAEAVQRLSRGAGEGSDADSEGLLEDLAQNLDALSTAALRLLAGSELFARTCQGDAWVQGLLAERGMQEVGSMGGPLAVASASLDHFLDAVLASRGQ